jgi:hypothetical protein
MKLRRAASAALALSLLAPHVALAQDARITPTLSTTMQRVCDVETTRILLMNAGQAAANPQPALETQTGGLQASQTGNGWRFVSTSGGSDGDLTLRFETTADGTVTAATLSGASIDAYSGRPGADVPTLASTMAEDVPERLLLGRTFAVGDSYYPEALRRSLLDRMTKAFDLPVDANGSIDMRYEGEVEFEGRRAWRFAGRITVAGQFPINASGTIVGIDHVTEAVVLHDAETGLVLKYDAQSDDRASLDGRPFRHQKTTNGFTCEIIPQ